MDDSSINPLLLTSSAHLENVEQLIRNLEKQTLDLDNFEDILSNRNRQELITKSFTAVSANAMGIDDVSDDNFLLKSISLTNTNIPGLNNENLSMDSLFNQRDIFENDDYKKQQTPPVDQSLLMDQEGGFTWDDQYDARANYRLTFSTDKPHHIDPKSNKPHKHRHHHHHHHRHHQQQQHKYRTTDSQANSTYSDDGLNPNLTNNMNDWSMRSSLNVLEHSISQDDNKSSSATGDHQHATFNRSQSHPLSFSPQQQIPVNNNNNNTSPNSSTTSSSSSASWKRMKESQRTTSGIETKETRPQSPLSLYKIFQQKSQTAASSSSAASSRSAFQIYRQQSDSIVPNDMDNMTVSDEKILSEKSKSSSSSQQKPPLRADRPSSRTNSSTDQAIQTSIFLDSSMNSQMNSRFQPTSTMTPKSESYDQLSTDTNSRHLTVPSHPSPLPNSSSTIHKSLPDLAFISQYSKELPRSRTTSPLPPSSSMNSTNTASSSTTNQQMQEPERPRTLKAIKRYKNSKHSTEPLGVFYSPQLRKTFAAVPASAVINNGSNEERTIIKMKLPPPSSYPTRQQQNSALKSCLKYGSRANSCDIQAMLQDRRSPAPVLSIPEPITNTESLSPSSKRRCSEADAALNPQNNIWPSDMHTTGSSNDLNNYVLPDYSRGHRSDHDLTALQQNQTKKSVSFSENIAKQLISPCNPAIQFDPAPEIFVNDFDTNMNDELAMALHGDKDTSTRKITSRYGEMRRCQTDIIVVDRIHHLHSFTESPPNEFCFQETDSLASEHEDDQAIMERTHVNIIPNLDEPMPITSTVDESKATIEKMTSSNDKENKMPEQSVIMNASTVTLIEINDPALDGILERTNRIVKRIFEIKISDTAFFLTNEHHPQLDSIIKDDLCTVLRNLLEHGLQPQQKDLPLAKQTTLWKIIETVIEQGQAVHSIHEAKNIVQNISPYWLYKFQAFVYILLNKNELINWLYHFMKQKFILPRYYKSDALILTATPPMFNLFDRLMSQLEKLSPLAFRLTYKLEPIPADINEQLMASTISMNSSKSSVREWAMTMSRRASKSLTQSIAQPVTPPPLPPPSTTTTTTAGNTQPTDTLRSTFTRKLNSLFTRANPTPTTTSRKTSSAVTAKLPSSRPHIGGAASPASAHRPRLSNVFANATAAATPNKPVIVSTQKVNNTNRTGVMRRGISPSVVVAPSPPPTLNATGATSATPSTTTTTFQSKIPRPSLNVDKPKSARYRSTAAPPK
ncbi:unnamed protein product [Adineta steineri]|uniref:RUN domain-containing protein n=1 Tax=Adineta steineri TaxID=433720 RepID=A0A819I7J0_9BILA|nr:unnamed protein product [Adineta steineri]CAF3909230.1 unnamed protein product [Adineta steineri]